MAAAGVAGAAAVTTTTASEASTGPVAEKIPHDVLFGKVGEEQRGDNPMAKPIKLDDPYFWMRDDGGLGGGTSDCGASTSTNRMWKGRWERSGGQ